MGARGFTLVELLIVLAIMALVMTYAPPLIVNALPGLRLQTATHEIGAALRAARGMAVAENREAVFTLDTETGRYRGDGAGEGRLSGDLGISFVTARSEQIDRATARIRFFPDGGSTGGSITLGRGERVGTVTVDWLTGRVSLRE
jgi:general secretion pathway protein H